MLQWVKKDHGVQSVIDINEHREVQLNRLADICEQHLQMDDIEQILQAGVTTSGSMDSAIKTTICTQEVNA